MSAINTETFLRLNQIIGNAKALRKAKKSGRDIPYIEPIIPVSASSWWYGVKSGKYPQPIKLGPRTTVWLKSDVLALLLKGVLK